jgi:hypothetical protein
MYKDSVCTTKKTQHFSTTMLFTEIIALSSENHTKPINTLYGQNAELWTVKAGGTYTYHLALGWREEIKKPSFLSVCSESALSRFFYALSRSSVLFSILFGVSLIYIFYLCPNCMTYEFYIVSVHFEHITPVLLFVS